MLQTTEKEVIDICSRLAKIPAPSGQERQVADFLKRELSKYTSYIKEDLTGRKFGGNTGNLIVRIPAVKGKEDDPVLLLSAHMDRVKPAAGCRTVIKNGFLKSKEKEVLGADDIAGISAILTSLKLLRENSIKHGPLRLIFSVAEEKGLLGAKLLKEKEYRDCDYGIVIDAEGEIGTIINQSPAKVKLNAKIKGFGNSQKIKKTSGVRSNKIASRAISAMPLGVIDYDTNASISVVRGGVANNKVVDLIELEGAVTGSNPHKLNYQLEKMKQIIIYYTRHYQGSVEFREEKLYDSFCLSKNTDLIYFLTQSAYQQGLKVAYRESCGGNDANVFNNRGLPSVNLAAGIKNAHSSEETISIASLVKLVEYLVCLVKNCRISAYV